MRISTLDGEKSKVNSDYTRRRKEVQQTWKYPSKIKFTEKVLGERNSRREREQQYQTIEERKYAPLEFYGEDWQRDRCLKAISLQPCVQELVSVIEEKASTLVEREKQKYDDNIRKVGLEYESIRQKLDQDIRTLQELEISVKGENYQLTRLSPADSNLARPEKVNEFLGDTFIIANGEPIRLNFNILSNEGYYEERYNATQPAELERNLKSINAKLERYQAIGRYFGFLLETKGYIKLKEAFETMKNAYAISQERKRQMETYQLLDQKRLSAITSYLVHLERLQKSSEIINELFEGKSYLQYLDETHVLELTIQEIMVNDEYNELTTRVQEYISKICSNDEETMTAAYELVKGEYPVNVLKRNLYDLLIATLGTNTKEENRRLTLSSPNNRK